MELCFEQESTATLEKETVVSLVIGSEDLAATLSSINGLWILAWIELNYVNG